MGHLTLMSEDVISALEHYPPDLRTLIAHYAPVPDWEEYVNGRYNETKKKDTALLGGGKPVIAPGQQRVAARWKVDEAETPAATADAEAGAPAGEERGEFRRASGNRPIRESSADFGPAPVEVDDDDDDGDDDGPPQVRAPPQRGEAHFLTERFPCTVRAISRPRDAGNTSV